LRFAQSAVIAGLNSSKVGLFSLSSANIPTAVDAGGRNRAFLILLVMPLFFSSNIIFGRAAVTAVEPFTLAFLRWGLAALILVPFVLPDLRRQWASVRTLAKPLLLMGFLGMWVCGAIVYLALKYTSATNGTLIYTSSPVLIILFEWMFRGHRGGMRESAGVVLAFAGVVVIVAKGSWSTLLALQFNLGDLLFVATAISWAVYSFLLKSSRFDALQTLPLFMLIAACGAFLLAPFALFEVIWWQTFPASFSAWGHVAGIVIFASLLAFSLYQYGIKTVGAPATGVYLYLLPVYGVGLAVTFLGEQLELFHLWGIVLVLGGVVLATFPARLLKRFGVG